jgi:drug/metabolite transporter (DMT)-like permease
MKRRVSDLRAIAFAITGFTCWVLGDSCVKWVGQFGFPPYEVVAFMGFFMAITLAVQAALRRDLGSLRPRSLPRQLLRSMLDMANNVCVVIALRHLSLTMFYVLVFLSPITIAVLSRFTLREKVSPRKAIALLLGFAGVIVAVAPWNHTERIDLIGVAACMVCVACFSVNMIWSRVLTRTEPPESLAFFSGVVTSIAGLAISGRHLQPLTPSLAGVVIAMGVFCACGTLCFYIAVKYTSAGNVAPYHYTQLITGTFVSWLVWHDRPSLNVILGGILILASGVMIALAARTAQPEHASAPCQPAA